MKSVLISIKPRWCELIVSGKKTIEVRKTIPKLETPFKCYIYETKGKYIGRTYHTEGVGKVIGEFVCNLVDRYEFAWCDHPELGISGDGGDNWYCIDDEDLKKTCIPEIEFYAYGGREDLYGWHISKLVIYDKPKPLNEFFYACDKPRGTDCSVCVDHRENKCKAVSRPPQSWCYVEELSA